jgi:hypothetical protein
MKEEGYDLTSKITTKYGLPFAIKDAFCLTPTAKRRMGSDGARFWEISQGKSRGGSP